MSKIISSPDFPLSTFAGVAISRNSIPGQAFSSTLATSGLHRVLIVRLQQVVGMQLLV
ncbi:MAG: hypothetical protein WKF89_01440 [Chitinophagaceae bacterium]